MKMSQEEASNYTQEAIWVLVNTFISKVEGLAIAYECDKIDALKYAKVQAHHALNYALEMLEAKYLLKEINNDWLQKGGDT